MFQTSAAGEKLSINLWNGKQKFGKPLIQIQNGENVLMRPRLHLTVPMSEAKAVKEGQPLLLLSFSHLEDKYDITLVHNAASETPDAVVTKKE